MCRCALCGIRYDVSARTYRDIKAGRVMARCVIHRKRSRPATVTAAMRRWWLDRYPLDEIVEMAQAIEGALGHRITALTAGASGPTGPTGPP